jgi:hypothetical protein
LPNRHGSAIAALPDGVRRYANFGAFWSSFPTATAEQREAAAQGSLNWTESIVLAVLAAVLAFLLVFLWRQ